MRLAIARETEGGGDLTEPSGQGYLKEAGTRMGFFSGSWGQRGAISAARNDPQGREGEITSLFSSFTIL